MPRKSPFKIILTDHEKEELRKIERTYTLPYYRVVRAKIILLAAEGLSNKEIGERLDLPREIASKWRKRFFERGPAGLEDQPGRGRPPRFSPSSHRGD
jgi:transposase